MKKIQLIVLAVTVICLLIVLVSPASAALTKINQGGTVFIGEEGLDISQTVGTYSKIGWWASPSQVGSGNQPSKSVDISSMNKNSFFFDPDVYRGYQGLWFAYDVSPPTTSPAFTLADPALDIRIWDLDSNTDVSARSVSIGDRLTFRIDTNMYSAVNPSYRVNPNAATDGYITIRVKNDNGAILDSLSDSDSSSHSLLNQYVDRTGWFWGATSGTGWGTGVTGSSNAYQYPAGTYVIWAESNLNNMKNKYKNGGADYTGKTVSEAYTITLVTPNLKIEASRDSVVRSKTFSVTMSGKPATSYYLWVKGTGGMTGTSQNRPPVISLSQAGVFLDPEAGPFTIGGYAFTNGGGATILSDVPPAVTGAPNNRYYARVLTSASGTRTVQFETSPDTKPGSYTFKVENGALSDIVSLLVQKGEVTISASGDQSYNFGETVHFSGINTETSKVYLFTTGPGLCSRLSSPSIVTNNNAATFDSAMVGGDNTWSYNWVPSSTDFSPGTYTIYAVSFPNDNNNMGSVAYGTVSVIVHPVATSTTATPTVSTTATATVTSTVTKTPTPPVTIAPTPQPTGSVTPMRTATPVKTTRKITTKATPVDMPTPKSPVSEINAFLSIFIAGTIVLVKKI